MHISLFNNFGAQNSGPVFQAIARGLQAHGHSISFHNKSADAAVIWSMLWTGRMRGNQEIYQTFTQQHRPVIVAEVGMIRRGSTWKLGVNGVGIDAYHWRSKDFNRADKLGLTAQPWKSGTNVVIAMQRQDSAQWQGQPPMTQWLASTVETIKSHTDRPIVVRPHPRGPSSVPAGCLIDRPQFTLGSYDDFDFNRVLENAHCVVNWNSGPGPQALIAGVPAFVGPTSLASALCNWDLSQIENPPRPDRTEWLEYLAHTEWTVGEISSGLPFEHLIF